MCPAGPPVFTVVGVTVPFPLLGVVVVAGAGFTVPVSDLSATALSVSRVALFGLFSGVWSFAYK